MVLFQSQKFAAKSRRTGRPSLVELLEGRMLLSTVVVNTTLDGVVAGKTSLRSAIAIANAATSATTITFDPTVFATAKTITLNGSQLELSNTKATTTTITGPVAGVTINGGNKSRVFLVDTGTTLVMSGIDITGGSASDLTGGGGINNSGTLTLSDSIISKNFSSDNNGGIVNFGTATLTNVMLSGNATSTFNGAGANGGTMKMVGVTIIGNSASIMDGGFGEDGSLVGSKLTMSNSTVTGNSAPTVGGVSNNSAGIISLTNVTIAGNKATSGDCGGLQQMHGGTVTMANVTITGNAAIEGGGGVQNIQGTINVSNSIIAGNSAASALDVSGSVVSKGRNLIGKTDGSSGWTSADYTGTVANPLDAELGSLSSNGGPTQTVVPLTGSPAIDHGSNSLIPSGVTTDQRGLPRTYNGIVDIGAVEVQPLIQITKPANQTAVQGLSKSVTLGSFTQYTNATPFKDTINWGDGSVTTTLSLTAAGTIPATAHTFAKVGMFTVTESIADANGNKSNIVTFTETVTAPTGSIAGAVFNDVNGDGKIDNGEVGLGLWTVYLDLNNDGKLDIGDKSMTTDITGKWSFAGLLAGTYTIRVVPVSGISATKPTGGGLTITLAAGQNSTGSLFGERAVG